MRPHDWRDLLGPYIRAVNIVSSVAIEHPEWSPALRQRLVERLYMDLLGEDRTRAKGGKP